MTAASRRGTRRRTLSASCGHARDTECSSRQGQCTPPGQHRCRAWPRRREVPVPHGRMTSPASCTGRCTDLPRRDFGFTDFAERICPTVDRGVIGRHHRLQQPLRVHKFVAHHRLESRVLGRRVSSREREQKNHRERQDLEPERHFLPPVRMAALRPMRWWSAPKPERHRRCQDWRPRHRALVPMASARASSAVRPGDWIRR